MTLDKARELLQVQVDFGGSITATPPKLILSEVMREHRQAAVDKLMREVGRTGPSVSNRAPCSTTAWR